MLDEGSSRNPTYEAISMKLTFHKNSHWTMNSCCGITFVLFFFCYQSICITRSDTLELNWFNQVVSYFLNNNDIAIDTIVLIDHPDECKNSSLCNSVWKVLFEAHLMIWSNDGYIPFLKVKKQNTSFRDVPTDEVNALYVMTSQAATSHIFKSQTSRSLSKNSWLILTEEVVSSSKENDNKILENGIAKLFGMESHSALHIDSQVYVLLSNGLDLQLYEIFRLCRNFNLTIRKLLYINKSNLEISTKRDLIWDRRDDLSGCSIPVAYTHGPPYFQPALNKTASCENFRKVQNEMVGSSCVPKNPNSIVINGIPMVGKSAYTFKLLIVALNFTPTWIKADDDAYGVFDKAKKEWSNKSLMRLVVDHEAELAAIELTVTKTRSEYVGFSAQIEVLRSRLYMQRPPSAFSWTTFFEVFHNQYWGLFFFVTGLSILLVAVFMAVLSKFRQEFISSWIQRISSSVTVVGLGLLDLDADMAVNVDFRSPNSMRLLFLSVSFFGLLNKEVYEAGLTSQLTVQELNSPINSLEELTANPKYQILITKGGADEDYFKEARDDNNPAAFKTYNDKVKNTPEALVNSLQSAKEKILEDPYKVYFSSEVAIDTGVSEYPCRLVASQKAYFKSPSAYPFHSGSHYLKLFSKKITVLGETGQYDLVGKQSIREKPIYKCIVSEGGYNELGYKTTFTAFLFMGSGALIAIFYCFFEYSILRYMFNRR